VQQESELLARLVHRFTSNPNSAPIAVATANVNSVWRQLEDLLLLVCPALGAYNPRHNGHPSRDFIMKVLYVRNARGPLREATTYGDPRFFHIVASEYPPIPRLF
jgi:hypothetical protein